jgi:putative ABC transport system permease protein
MLTDLWRDALGSFRDNRLRTILTAGGVFWGVFMLVIMLGFGRGLEKAAVGSFANWTLNTVSFSGKRTSKPF